MSQKTLEDKQRPAQIEHDRIKIGAVMRKYLTFSLLILSVVLSPLGSGLAQEKARKKENTQENVVLPKSEEHKVLVRLVLVDVLATDRQGNVVTGLTKEDFEIYEDGRSQTINSLDFIKLQEAVTGKEDKEVPQREKTFFVIFDSINSTKRILDRNRDEIMEKLLALLRMGHEVMVFELREDKNMEVLQALTTDEELITAAVKKASGSIWVDKAADALSMPHVLAGDPIRRREDMDSHRSIEQQFKVTNRQMYEMQTRKRFEKTISGLLSAMNVIKDLPGRKPVLYISSGFPNISFETMYDVKGGIDQGFARSQVSMAKVKDPFKVLGKTKSRQGSDIFHDLMQFANSHNISFYTMDPDNYLRFVLPDIAYDNFPRKISSSYDFSTFQDEITEIKRIELNNLTTLAEVTGGTTLQGGERFDNFEKYIVRDLSSHYELSYYPTRTKPDGDYHKIKVDIKKEGVRIKAREGYFDYLAEQKEQLMFASAASNPGLFKDVDFKFSMGPFKTDKDRLRLWVNLGLPVQDLILGGDQFKEYTLIKTNLWMNDDSENQAFAAQMNIPIVLSESFRRRLAQAEFFGYSICSDELRIKPGLYTLIFAVYDQESGRVGTVEQMLEIPDYKKSSPRIQTALFGRAVKIAVQGRPFTLSSKDGTLLTRSGKFYPMAGAEFRRGESVAVYIQISPVSPKREPAVAFDLIQGDSVIDTVPAIPVEKHWDKKAGVWHLVFSPQFNRFASGGYSLRITATDLENREPLVDHIPLILK
jgi:VWFA-related protein